MTPSLMPTGPDAQHVSDPSSMSVVTLSERGAKLSWEIEVVLVTSCGRDAAED